MKRFLLLIALAIGVVSCKSGVSIKKYHFAFNIDAHQVNLLPMKAAMKRYKLVLSDPDAKVLVFEGFPKKSLHEMPLKQLLTDWKALGFDKKSPTAAMIVFMPQKKGKMERLSTVLRLSNPEMERNKLSFDAIALSTPSSWIVGHPNHLGHLVIEATLKKYPEHLTKVH